MRTTAIIIFTIFTFCNLFGQSKNVLYGERDLKSTAENIYIDKDGTLYPSFNISDRSLEACNASLKEFYLKNPSIFLEISKIYNCSFNRYSKENGLVLNDSIISKFINQLNKKNINTTAFFIHGFRKSFKSANGDYDSPTDYSILNEAYTKYSAANSAIVNVYWDALYDCCFSSNSKKNKAMFLLFEEAQQNAEKTAVTLNKILIKTKSQTVDIVTHSLGAKVAVYSLLDVNDKGIKTPSNKVNLFLIAPAISPELISDNYLKRNSNFDLNNSDNYSLSIVYNEKDFALKKKDDKLGLFGPGPYKYGNTTLGCNYNDGCEKLKNYFKSNLPKSKIILYNLTSAVEKCHHVRCYCSNENLKAIFIDKNKSVGSDNSAAN